MTFGLLLAACLKPDLDGYSRCLADQDCSNGRSCQSGVCSPGVGPAPNDAGLVDAAPADAGMPASGVQLISATSLDGTVFEPRFGLAFIGPVDGLGDGLVLVFSDQVSAIEDVLNHRQPKDGRTMTIVVARVAQSDGGLRIEPPQPGAHAAWVSEAQTGAVFKAESRQYNNCTRGDQARLASGEFQLDAVSDSRVAGVMRGVLLGEAGVGLALRFDLPLELPMSEPDACEPVIHGDDCASVPGIPDGGGYYTVRDSNGDPMRVWCSDNGWALAARVTPGCRVRNAANSENNRSDATASCYNLPLDDLDADSTGESSMFKVLISASETTKARIYTGTHYKVWDPQFDARNPIIDSNGFRRLRPGTYDEVYTTTQGLVRFDPEHAWAISSCNQSQCAGGGICNTFFGQLCIAPYRASLESDGFILHRNLTEEATAISGWVDWVNTPFESFELWVKPLPGR